MTRTKKTGKPKSKSKSKSKQTKKVLCEHCGNEFSKKSNLNNHIQKIHKGLRWKCHICKEDQVSKHSHIRHYNARHPGELPLNVDVNQRYVGVYKDMPEKAKDSMIKELTQQIEVQKVLLKSFRKRLLATLKSNITLKSRLEIDCEGDKLEYNNLIGSIDESDDCSSSESDNENAVCDNSQSNHEHSDSTTSGEKSKGEENDNDDEDDDGDDEDDDSNNDNASSFYPDNHPVSNDFYTDDPDARGSGV